MVEQANRPSAVLAHAAVGLLERAGKFFRAAHPSFVVPGASAFLALVTFNRSSEVFRGLSDLVVFLLLPAHWWLEMLALLIVCYGCGLISFAGGRSVARIWRRWRVRRILTLAVAAYGLSTPAMEAELKKRRRVRQLYARLWTCILGVPEGDPSCAHARRLWDMAAMYDGLAFSCVLWAGAFAMHYEGIVPAVLAILTACACFRQGYSYFRAQVLAVARELSRAAEQGSEGDATARHVCFFG